MFGGLLIAAVDTEGKPGVAWRAQHAVGSARREAKHLRREAKGGEAGRQERHLLSRRAERIRSSR